MQALPVVVGAVVLSCAGSYAITTLAAPDPGTAPVDASATLTSEEVSALRDQLAASRTTIEEMTRRLDSLEAGPRSVARPARRAEIEAIVREVLAASGGVAADAAAGKGEPKLVYETALAKLDATTDWEAGEALWAEINKAGLTDQVVAELERRAAANPQDADAQATLGSAYIQQIASAPNVGLQGQLAIKADAAFDKALELDSNHWEARFVKATSYSFWPPAMGKQPEAIEHFEILLEQQESSSRSRPEHAQTYIFLGNLYNQTGKGDQAKELWRRGAQRFPDNDELRKKSSK